jgi:hypothetical protein
MLVRTREKKKKEEMSGDELRGESPCLVCEYDWRAV